MTNEQNHNLNRKKVSRFLKIERARQVSLGLLLRELIDPEDVLWNEAEILLKKTLEKRPDDTIVHFEN